MKAGLRVISIVPGASLQDAGRVGYMAKGLSVGGAMDPLALAEGAILLGEASATAKAIEFPGGGGRFVAEGANLLIALTGAPMRAQIDGRAIPWHAAHLLKQGSELRIGAVQVGQYGYVSVAGLKAMPLLGSVSTHFSGGLGTAIETGDRLEATTARQPGGMALNVKDRFSGGEIRVLSSVQTDQFEAQVLDRFQGTNFRKDHRANRMGARLEHQGPGFGSAAHLSILSEFIRPGDIQITGEGTPFVLLNECQTMGGYPRIASVISADLPKVAQAAPGANLRFRFVDLEEALAARAAADTHQKRLANDLAPLVRDPADIPDLLSYQLVGGMISAKDTAEEDDPNAPFD